MTIRKYTSIEVTKLREATGEGVIQCTQWLRSYFLREAIQQASTLEDIKEILLSYHTPNYPDVIKEIVN